MPRQASPAASCRSCRTLCPTLAAVSSLELKVPPPVVALLLAVLMWFVSLLVASLEVQLAYRVAGAVVLAVVGLGISLAAKLSFWRARTTINPIKPAATSSFVSQGVYRFTRNPMYLGRLLQLLGWAVFLANVFALLLVPVFVLYINRFQIKPEERVLSVRFGSEYAAYRERVPRWL
jgi:protein-S-isoprenylcysteine O-methyltransferase Ste14